MDQFLEKEKRWLPICFWSVFALGAVLRLWNFGVHPAGLSQDEASIAYESWALLRYGFDRNGYSWPVHFLAWGSGQNALYAYLSMPFIALLGLNSVSARMVNLVFGLLSLPVCWSVGRMVGGKATGLLFIALTAISPWHIMLSRWGLESNLFPAMLLLVLWALLKALKNPVYLYGAAVLAGLSLYSYGSAYLVTTLFFGLSLLLFLIKKKADVKHCVFAGVLYACVGLPIYLFVLVNLFRLGDLSIGPFSIPQTYGGRMLGVLNNYSLRNILQNFIGLVLLQTDGLERNSFAGYGCFYLLSLPFCIGGLVGMIRRKTAAAHLVLIALVTSLSLFFIYQEANINRMNAIYLPLILCAAVGLSAVPPKKEHWMSLLCAYALMLGGFTSKYFGRNYRESIGNEFFASFMEAVDYACEIGDGSETVYVANNVNQPYIYVLFCAQVSPGEYLETVEIADYNVQFQQVMSFGRYVFGFDAEWLYERPGIYIVPNEMVDWYESDLSGTRFDNYTVVRASG